MSSRPTTRLGSITFEHFSHPQLESDGSTRTVSHTILPQEPDGEGGEVTQVLGVEGRTWTLRGDCYEDTASDLDDMIGETVSLRHSRHSGTVTILDVSTSPSGSKDENGWRYTYTAELKEVRNP